MTDHYLNHPPVPVRPGSVSRAGLRGVLVQAWRQGAPGRLGDAFDRRA